MEVLDEQTGITMAALSRPLAFSETGIYDVLVPDKQPSMVFMGPCGAGIVEAISLTCSVCRCCWGSAVICWMTYGVAGLSID